MDLSFSDENPTTLGKLLEKESLQTVTVDAELFDHYAEEFRRFEATDGNTLTVIVPEPSTMFSMPLAQSY